MPAWEVFVLQTPGAGGAAAGALFPVLGAGTEAVAPRHPLSSGSPPELLPLGFVPAASGRAHGRSSASFLRGAPVQFQFPNEKQRMEALQMGRRFHGLSWQSQPRTASPAALLGHWEPSTAVSRDSELLKPNPSLPPAAPEVLEPLLRRRTRTSAVWGVEGIGNKPDPQLGSAGWVPAGGHQDKWISLALAPAPAGWQGEGDV